MNLSNTKDQTLRVGTRSSQLATAQVDEFISILSKHSPEIKISMIPIKTEGDIKKDIPLSEMNRGMFVREIEQALISKRIDVAVHSAKDIPPNSHPELRISAMLKRADPRDTIVNKWKLPLTAIPDGAIIGTSSPRRSAFISVNRPQLVVKSIRGNVDTRVKKIGKGYDGIIIAAAGLERLRMIEIVDQFLDIETFIPDAGQGAIAIQTRMEDEYTSKIVSKVNHFATFVCVTAERSFMRALGGNCNSPHASYAEINKNLIKITGLVSSYDGKKQCKETIYGNINTPEQTGSDLADKLIGIGALNI
ncbi:MAG: hydroxymethylbilane synthase [Dehalococcoidia bacterium]|nr:hydroxymethylbilane synthase [Dehalococcoidia bacterium]